MLRVINFITFLGIARRKLETLPMDLEIWKLLMTLIGGEWLGQKPKWSWFKG